MATLDGHGEVRPPFATWLIQQRDRGDWIDGLANTARADRDFPRRGDVGQVRSRLNVMGADGDAFAALDDAELDWLSY